MNTQKALGNMGNRLNFNEEIKKCKTQDDLFGENGLMKKFVKEALESMLQAEMEEHLGRKKHEEQMIMGQTTEMESKNLYSMQEMGLRFTDWKGQFKPIVVIIQHIWRI